MQEEIDPTTTSSVLRPKPGDSKVTAETMHASWEQVHFRHFFETVD